MAVVRLEWRLPGRGLGSRLARERGHDHPDERKVASAAARSPDESHDARVGPAVDDGRTGALDQRGQVVEHGLQELELRRGEPVRGAHHDNRRQRPGEAQLLRAAGRSLVRSRRNTRIR